METVQIVDLARQLAALLALAYASCHDVGSRKVGDATWLFAGAAGVAMALASGQAASEAVSLLLGALAATACSRLRLFSGGDCLCLVALAAVLPYVSGVPAVLAVVPMAVLLCPACGAAICIAHNLPDLARGRLFPGVKTSPAGKALAFFLVYRYRKGKRLATGAREGRGMIFLPASLHPRQGDEPGGLVAPAVPVIPIFLASLVLLLLPGI